MNYPPQPGPYPQNRPPQQHWQQPSPHPYGPPAQQPAGAGGIAVTSHFFPLAFMFALIKPKILIDGYESPPASWGRTVLPAQPGQHRVHVHVPYFLPSKIGPADALVDVYPGRVAELEYKAPVWSYSAGSLGPPPQSYNGVGITIAVMVVPFVLLLLFFMLMVLISI